MCIISIFTGHMIDDDDQTLDTGVYDVYIVRHLKSCTVVTIDLLTASQNLSYYQCRIIMSLFTTFTTLTTLCLSLLNSHGGVCHMLSRN